MNLHRNFEVQLSTKKHTNAATHSNGIHEGVLLEGEKKTGGGKGEGEGAGFSKSKSLLRRILQVSTIGPSVHHQNASNLGIQCIGYFPSNQEEIWGSHSNSLQKFPVIIL